MANVCDCVRTKGRFFNQDGSLNKHTTQLYIKSAIEYERTLMTLVHIIDGMPERGPELRTYTWRNTRDNVRSVFVRSGKMLLLFGRTALAHILAW